MKKSKRLCSFRLSDTTKEQLKDMARGLDISEADVISLSVSKLFKKYDDNMFSIIDEVASKYLK